MLRIWDSHSREAPFFASSSVGGNQQDKSDMEEQKKIGQKQIMQGYNNRNNVCGVRTGEIGGEGNMSETLRETRESEAPDHADPKTKENTQNTGEI